jgi:hypothetical protein
VSDEPSAAEVALACRRDALLLLLVAWGVVAWAWTHGALLALFGSIITGGLFVLLVGLLRQGEQVAVEQIRLPGWWRLGLVVVAASPATALLAWAAWQRLASWSLMGVLALLAFGWQMWLYFWMLEPPDTRDEE